MNIIFRSNRRNEKFTINCIEKACIESMRTFMHLCLRWFYLSKYGRARASKPHSRRKKTHIQYKFIDSDPRNSDKERENKYKDKIDTTLCWFRTKIEKSTTKTVAECVCEREREKKGAHDSLACIKSMNVNDAKGNNRKWKSTRELDEISIGNITKMKHTKRHTIIN